MADNRFCFIHIGHHKCGSTFIQWEMLPRLRAMRPLLYELHHIPANRLHYEQLMYLVHCAEPYFDPGVLDPLRKSAADANCLSWEGLVGHGTMEGPTGMSLEHTARRLREVFGPTRILFVIRNQWSWIPSWYQDDLQFGFACDFERWFRWRLEFSHLNWCKYAPIIETYGRHFGMRNIKTLLFEDLFDRRVFQDLFASWDMDASGLEEVRFDRGHNASICPRLYSATRFVNRTCGTKLNQADGKGYDTWRNRLAPSLSGVLRRRGLGGGRAALEFPEYREMVRALYHEDNARTSGLINVDLHERGYP